MDQLKKTIPILAVLLALLLGMASVFSAVSFAFAMDEIPQEMVTAYGVSAYETSQLDGDPIAFFEGGKTVIVQDQDGDAYLVTLDSQTGWVSANALYQIPKGESFIYEQRRITVTPSVRDVYLYATPDRNGEVICKLSDGARVIRYGQQGDYIAVVYGEQRGWVLKEHVTGGLSYNQFLAVVILSVTFGAAILIGILIYLRRIIPRKKNN